MPRRLIATMIVLGAIAPAVADENIRAAHRADLGSVVDGHIDTDFSDWLGFYKDLHTNPELSEQEKESSRKIAERLTKSGYQVTTGVGGYGVVGILENGDGPTLLIRGDMDALPIVEDTGLPYASKTKVERDDGSHVGVMHACGHDVHQTCLIATAATLAKLREAWRGKLMIVAQPAEEIGVGAKAMIDDGIFSRFGKPDYCLALHVSSTHAAGTVAYTPGWALANVDSVDITIHGQGGHGSRPNETIDPIVAAAHLITALQTIVSRRLEPQEPGVVTVGSIHAGSKHNIIPDSATLQLTVRSYGDETRKLLLDSIRQITRDTVRALGCKRDPDILIREREYTPSTYNDPAFTVAVADVLRAALGTERVIEQKAVMGGEDFGRFPAAAGVPGLIFWLGSVPREKYDAAQNGGPPLPSIHSSKYYPDPEPTIRTGVKSLTSIALSLLDKPR
jgi:hippurate hydrolase